jgi:DNA-binding beta-propeller fold protein YncE
MRCGNFRIAVNLMAAKIIVVADTGNNRIKKHEVVTGNFISMIGTGGVGVDQFNQPHSVCVDVDDKFIYVSDGANNRIHKRLFSDLSSILLVGSLGVGDNQFNQPHGLVTDGTHLFINDYNNRRCFKRLKSDLSYVSKYGSVGAGLDQLNGNWGIGVTKDRVFITEGNNNRFMARVKSDLTYALHRVIAGWAPIGMCTDGTFLYVTTTGIGNHAIWKLDLSFNALAVVGGAVGAGDNSFSTPMGVVTDGINVWCADSGNNRVKCHRCSDLAYQYKFGSAGVGINNFQGPRDVSVDGIAPSKIKNIYLGSKPKMRYR